MAKRRDLERHLRAHGARLLREGGDHSIWVSELTGARAAIPRHRELGSRTVRSICRALGAPPLRG
jgi:mRNA interferase HicA